MAEPCQPGKHYRVVMFPKGCRNVHGVACPQQMEKPGKSLKWIVEPWVVQFLCGLPDGSTMPPSQNVLTNKEKSI